jgi:TetR/AcrR family transcriptional regulator, mexJK operon transcriptional repressor
MTTTRLQTRSSRPTGKTRGIQRPGPGRPTREQAKLRNFELLDRALDLFLENGFERTTMEGIASDVGMAKRTVYAQYGDKRTLFKASLERAIDEWIVPVEVLRAAESDDFEETLLEIGRILVDNILTPAGLRLLRITNAEANRMPEISAYTYEQGTKLTISYLADLLHRRLDLGKSDAHDAALAFLYLVVGGPANSAAWGVKAELAGIHRHTRYCVRMFLYGMLSGKMRGTARTSAQLKNRRTKR